MTQFAFPLLDPNVDSGTSLAGHLNNWNPALISNHRGPGRPPYAVAGTIWVDSDFNRPFYHDGATDLQVALLGDVAGYMPITGGNFSGPIAGTTAQFNSLALGSSTMSGKRLAVQDEVSIWNATVRSVTLYDNVGGVQGGVVNYGGTTYLYSGANEGTGLSVSAAGSVAINNGATITGGLFATQGIASSTLVSAPVVSASTNMVAPVFSDVDSNPAVISMGVAGATVGSFLWSTTNYVNGALIYSLNAGALSRFICTGANANEFEYFSSGTGPTNVALRGADQSASQYVIHVDVLSDQTAKENITACTVDALSVVNALELKEFDFKIEHVRKAKNTGKKMPVPVTPADRHVAIGLIAQQVQGVVPEAVYQQTADLLGLHQAALIPYLIKAIQELTAEVELLKQGSGT